MGDRGKAVLPQTRWAIKHGATGKTHLFSWAKGGAQEMLPLVALGKRVPV